MSAEPAPPVPDVAGTFAVYLMPDGTAGLVLDIQQSNRGPAGISRHHLPQVIVDMVLYGKRPSPGKLLKMFAGGGVHDVPEPASDTDTAAAQPSA